MLETQSQFTPAFSAFESQLRSLCLREFPCGTGTWRETRNKPLGKVKSTDNVDSRFSVTLKDFGAQNEKTETLEEYVGSAKSPWNLDYSWSAEAKQLREIAVKSPWLIDDNFILNHFKTLRIVSKNVSEVDANLLRFKNLEELTLSCNYITEINSRHLPSSLKVLEVCANQVSDLSALCINPPDLIHLGLGYNKICDIGDYLTGSFWPELLSLDLSNNNLSDLLDAVRKLGSLPKLRNLILQGNPLALIPGYRGYVIDSMRKLSILDDIMISADERHHFKGLARRREYILDEAKVQFSVSYIKGIPTPDELKNPEDQPEFPVIERKYFVQFMFLEDTSSKTDFEAFVFGPENSDLASLHTERTAESTATQLRSDSHLGDEALNIEKNVVFTQEPDVTIARSPTPDTNKARETQEVTAEEEVKTEEREEVKQIKVAPLNSEGGMWSEEVELNWSQTVVRDDLNALRDFFRQGMEFSVVEEMVLGFPVITEEGEAAQKVEMYSDEHPSTPKGSGKQEGKKGNKNRKDEPAKSKDGKDAKDKKKKKEAEQELKRNPPVYTTLATWHVPLEEFLEGEFEYQSVYTHGSVELAPTIRSCDTESRKSSKGSRHSARRDGSRRPSRASRQSFMKDEDQKKKSRKDPKKDAGKDKKKPPSAVKKKDEAKDKSKERKSSAVKSGKDDKKGDKGKGGVKGGSAPVEDESEDNTPPPPLEVHISVRLHHWKTALDSLKDEEERLNATKPEETKS